MPVKVALVRPKWSSGPWNRSAPFTHLKKCSCRPKSKVDQVNADLGDAVTQGQIIVHISDEEQRYILAEITAQLHQSMEKLGLKKEKDRVKDVRETPDVRRAAADLMEARQRFNRVKNLVDQGIGAKVDLDSATTRFQAAQAGYDSTVNQTRNMIQEVERFKAQLDLQRRTARYVSGRRLRRW